MVGVLLTNRKDALTSRTLSLGNMLLIVILGWSNAVGTDSNSRRKAHMQTAPGTAAPQMSLVDHDGNEVDLSTLWRDKPRVLLFIRHFG